MGLYRDENGGVHTTDIGRMLANTAIRNDRFDKAAQEGVDVARRGRAVARAHADSTSTTRGKTGGGVGAVVLLVILFMIVSGSKSKKTAAPSAPADTAAGAPAQSSDAAPSTAPQAGLPYGGHAPGYDAKTGIFYGKPEDAPIVPSSTLKK